MVDASPHTPARADYSQLEARHSTVYGDRRYPRLRPAPKVDHLPGLGRRVPLRAREQSRRESRIERNRVFVGPTSDRHTIGGAPHSVWLKVLEHDLASPPWSASGVEVHDLQNVWAAQTRRVEGAELHGQVVRANAEVAVTVSPRSLCGHRQQGERGEELSHVCLESSHT